MKTYVDGNSTYGGTDIDINQGFVLFALGALFGAVDYLGGIALSVNKTTIMNMLSFYDKTLVRSTKETTKTIDPSGYTTSSRESQEYVYRKKDMFSLFQIQDEWSNLFWSQRVFQMIIPYIYISAVEIAVAVAFSLMLYFGYL